MHNKHSIPPQCHTIQLKLFHLASRYTSFLFAYSEGTPTSTISLTSQGKQGHKVSIEEAITSSADTVTHFSQSNSGRGLQLWAYRLLTWLATLLTQASSAKPNWSGRFSVAFSKPQEPSDVQ